MEISNPLAKARPKRTYYFILNTLGDYSFLMQSVHAFGKTHWS